MRYYYEDELELANRVSGIAGDVLERGGRPRLAKTVPIYKIGGPFKDLPRGTVEVWVPRRKAPARQQVARRAPRAARP